MSGVKSVLVTGAAGNLGQKLIAHLLGTGWCERVVGVDVAEGEAGHGDPRVSYRVADLADAEDPGWRRAVADVDALVHFAAANPSPDASWEESVVSYDMTANLVAAALAGPVKRFVFATSNHVMGQYKDPPRADRIGPGRLTTDLEPGPGTTWFDGTRTRQGTAYAVSKLMGERLLTSAAAVSGGRLTAVSLRIGWCQPGENRPETISATGLPADQSPAPDYPEAQRDLAWFRGMWLSNRDFLQVVEKALRAEAGAWPAPGIVVNAMSDNAGMVWDLGATRRLLGYTPQDDLYRSLSAGP
ncbi:NAD-dependent epimerase/dehydratase family protein [Prosthecomicrobium sp. N25]|uniref:NAD-dependent epimerase/dehydratase family protein n=1 Tax=Prosthecomicrobium sp. N25 TaxID=3129254 RepID=UPI0030770DEC